MIDAPLDWNEGPAAEYFTDRPDWDGYASLLLWAAHAEHPDLPRPARSVKEWASDEAFRRSTAAGAKTAYPNLLCCESWLPYHASFTFTAATLTGNEVSFGSVYELGAELDRLNKETWNVSDATISKWKDDGRRQGELSEDGARFGMAVMTKLARDAASHRLPMKLDY
jgi:hypothetical protein